MPAPGRPWTSSLVGENDDEVNLALTTVAPAGIVFASRESGLTGPRLVVERDDRGSGKGKIRPQSRPALYSLGVFPIKG